LTNLPEFVTLEFVMSPAGRPRKYAEGRHNATVRFTPKRYAALRAEADKNRRSLSEEVEVRVERSFADDLLAQIKHGVDQLLERTNS
jgi:hypothetical protein